MYNIIKKTKRGTICTNNTQMQRPVFDIANIDTILKYAGNDTEPIIDYLNFLRGIKIEKHNTYTDPITMLNAAGYLALKLFQVYIKC